jgi:hypothetical protein
VNSKQPPDFSGIIIAAAVVIMLCIGMYFGVWNS